MTTSKFSSRFQKTALAAVLAALAATGCAADQPLAGLGSIFGTPAQAQTAAASPTAGKSIEGEIDAAKALTYLYGRVQTASPGTKTITMSYGKKLDCTEWAPQPLSNAYINRFNYADIITPEDARKNAEACKILGEKYEDEGMEKYMLVTVSQYLAGDNKEIPAIVVASTFIKKNGQWTLESNNDFTVEIFDVGVGPLIVPGRAGEKKPGVLVKTSTDYRECMAHNIYAIVPYGNAARLLPLFSPGSDGDAGTTLKTCSNSCFGNVAFDTVTKGDYHDIIVSYDDCDSGKKLGSQRWLFQNGTYVNIKAASKGKKGNTKKRR